MCASLAGAFSFVVAGAFVVCGVVANPKAVNRILVIANEQERRVDITIDAQPFTSYIWPTTLKKPVLYPLRTARGTIITRGYPLEHAAERIRQDRAEAAEHARIRAGLAAAGVPVADRLPEGAAWLSDLTCDGQDVTAELKTYLSAGH